MDKYISEGMATFVHTEEGYMYLFEDKEKLLKQFSEEDVLQWYTHSIFDLMDGKEFYNNVDSGCIIDDDGTISDIFVNGYKSNLGLCHEGLCDGKFLVDGKTFLKMCDEFKIEVNWANK